MDFGKTDEVGPSVSSGGDKKQEIAAKQEECVDFNNEEEEEEVDGVLENFVPGPLLPLKEQIEKDKEDESLRRWKEKLLGCLESDLNGQMEPEVKFHSIGIVSSDSGEINTPFLLSQDPPDPDTSKHALFTLWEGSQYQLKLTFSVHHNIVSGLVYTNTVWKGGLQVDQSKGMLGTFAPQTEVYVQALEEETTPSGVFARGVYTAKLKFEDDDKRRHVELDYSFEIKKNNYK